MNVTLEQRVESVEQRLAQLEASRPPVKKDPLSTFGWAKDLPSYEEAAELGEEYRRSQTYEKEIEARGGDRT